MWSKSENPSLFRSACYNIAPGNHERYARERESTCTVIMMVCVRRAFAMNPGDVSCTYGRILAKRALLAKQMVIRLGEAMRLIADELQKPKSLVVA